MGVNYKHGIYGVIEKSTVSSETALNTIPVYIGSLPIHRINKTGLKGFDYSQYINKPVVINSYNDIKELNAYSDNWDVYSLCEALQAHFLNGEESVSPIILVNVLDPKKAVASEVTTKSITLTTEGANKVGYIEDDLCVLDDLTITDASELTNNDYSYFYDGDRVKIVITKKEFAKEQITVSYKQIEFALNGVTETEIKDSLKSLDYCEMQTGYIPKVLSAPVISQNPKLNALLVQKAIDKIAGKWGFVVFSDIPCEGNDTLVKAKDWKINNGYTSKLNKVFFPKAKKGNKIYHLSTLAICTMQRTDITNDDVPYISPSNKIIDADGIVNDDGIPVLFTEAEANELNKFGITTINIIKRQLRLWGSHMANYDYNNLDNINYEDRSDSDVRMMIYLLNHLQYSHIDSIDTSFSRKDIDALKTSVQTWLNSLVNEGKLLYATIEFNEASNASEDMVNGDFVFDLAVTLSPNSKSITFKLSYTTSGLSLLTSGGED